MNQETKDYIDDAVAASFGSVYKVIQDVLDALADCGSINKDVVLGFLEERCDQTKDKTAKFILEGLIGRHTPQS